MLFKPRAHHLQCRSNIVECYKVECCFDKVERYFDIVAVFGNNVERGFHEIASFRKSRNKLNMFNSFSTLSTRRNFVRHCCRKRQQCQNIVEATFDFVESTFDFVERIVRFAAFDNVSSTLLLVWIGL